MSTWFRIDGLLHLRTGAIFSSETTATIAACDARSDRVAVLEVQGEGDLGIPDPPHGLDHCRECLAIVAARVESSPPPCAHPPHRRGSRGPGRPDVCMACGAELPRARARRFSRAAHRSRR